eukprot:2865374-Amphidinium_carterae.1
MSSTRKLLEVAFWENYTTGSVLEESEGNIRAAKLSAQARVESILGSHTEQQLQTQPKPKYLPQYYVARALDHALLVMTGHGLSKYMMREPLRALGKNRRRFA